MRIIHYHNNNTVIMIKIQGVENIDEHVGKITNDYTVRYTSLGDWVYECQIQLILKLMEQCCSDNMINYLYSIVKWHTVKNIPDNYKTNKYLHFLSKNANITWDIIQENRDFPWYISGVSENPNITFDIIKKDRYNYPWNWTYVSKNPSITMDIIRDNPQYPWVRGMGISGNPNLTIDFIREYGDKYWYGYELSRNPILKWEDILDIYDIIIYGEECFFRDYLSWVWNGISQNPNITWDIIQNNPEKPWDWERILLNKSIPYDVVSENWEKLKPHYDNMSDEEKRNLNFKFMLPIIHDKNMVITVECYRKWRAVRRIRKWWLFDIYLNPFHRIGARRLERSYQEMMENKE